MNPIVGIHAFRQGGGTSTLTAYLALTLAQQGQQVAAIEVQSFSASSRLTEFRLLHYLNIPAPSNLRTLEAYQQSQSQLSGQTPGQTPGQPALMGNIAHAVFSQATSEVRGQVYALGLPILPGQNLEHYGQLLTQLSQDLKLDYLLLDLPAGLDESSLMMLGLVDILLIHLSPDQVDFQGTAVTVDIARRLQIPQMAIVVNQVPDIFDPQRLQQQIRDLYHLPLLGSLPFCGEIRLAIPYVNFSTLKKNHPFRNELELMSFRLQTLDQSDHLKSLIPPLSTPVTLLDILILPDAERQLTNWLIHRGPVQPVDVAHYLNTSPSVALNILEKLVNYGIVEPFNREGELYYQTLIDPP